MRNHNPFLKEKVVPFEVEKKISTAQMLRKMKDTSFQARSLGLAFDIWQDALKDDTSIFFGLSGAMVPAGMRKVIVTMIENRLIDCVVSTGANLFHDVHESLGRFHYKGSPHADDVELQKHGVDRMYDVYASEHEFTQADLMIANFAGGLEDRPYTTREFFYLLGRHVRRFSRDEGIVTAAARAGIPVYAPAIGDSSYGIALASGINKKAQKFIFNMVQDVEETARIVVESPNSGVFFVGGGTPKNFSQQTEVTANMMGYKVEGHKYCIQLTTDAPHWGGLSGCTFDESQSWGKIHHRAERITVYSDATIALPMLVSAMIEVGAASRRRLPHFVQERDLKVHFRKAAKSPRPVLVAR